MEQDFKNFMSLTEPDLVQEISKILNEAGIAHKIHDARSDFDPAFSNNNAGKSINIQLAPKDFSAAETVISEKMEFDEESIDRDHFLFEFTDQELKDVIKDSDEWHPIEVRLARHLLKKKGISITEADLHQMKQQRLNEKSKPEKSFREGIIFGYIGALGGGLLGFFIGNHLMSHKRTLPDGSQVYNYEESDRRHGKRILGISFISLIAWIVFFTLKNK